MELSWFNWSNWTCKSKTWTALQSWGFRSELVRTCEVCEHSRDSNLSTRYLSWMQLYAQKTWLNTWLYRIWLTLLLNLIFFLIFATTKLHTTPTNNDIKCSNNSNNDKLLLALFSTKRLFHWKAYFVCFWSERFDQLLEQVAPRLSSAATILPEVRNGF